jgi:hypothetical protein
MMIYILPTQVCTAGIKSFSVLSLGAAALIITKSLWQPRRARLRTTEKS